LLAEVEVYNTKRENRMASMLWESRFLKGGAKHASKFVN
jgi:hypothetical protein